MATDNQVPKVLKGIYVFLMGLLLLSFPYMMVTYTHFVIYHIPVWIWILRIVSAILALYLGQMWKDKGFRILMVYLFYILLRVIVTKPGSLFSDRFSESILTGIWVFTACYGLARILTPEETKKYLSVAAGIWTLAIAVSCCVGIYAAWRGERIYTAGDAAFWGLYPKRLMIPYLPTVSGALTSLTAMTALCAFMCCKKKYIRIFYGIALTPILLALALTDSRTGFISFALGAASLIFICYLLRNRTSDTTKAHTRSKKKLVLAFSASLLVCVSIVFLLMFAENSFHALRTRGGLLIPSAYAEMANDTVTARGFSGNSEMLTGRIELWRNTIQYLINNPVTLIFGAGKAEPMMKIGSQMAHTHNLPLMILLESGIVGVMILFLFALHVVKVGIKANHKTTYPLVLLSIVISILIGDMAECFAWTAASNFPSLAFLFVIIGVPTHANRNIQM